MKELAPSAAIVLVILLVFPLRFCISARIRAEPGVLRPRLDSDHYSIVVEPLARYPVIEIELNGVCSNLRDMRMHGLVVRPFALERSAAPLSKNMAEILSLGCDSAGPGMIVAIALALKRDRPYHIHGTSSTGAYPPVMETELPQR